MKAQIDQLLKQIDLLEEDMARKNNKIKTLEEQRHYRIAEMEVRSKSNQHRLIMMMAWDLYVTLQHGTIRHTDKPIDETVMMECIRQSRVMYNLGMQ